MNYFTEWQINYINPLKYHPYESDNFYSLILWLPIEKISIFCDKKPKFFKKT